MPEFIQEVETRGIALIGQHDQISSLFRFTTMDFYRKKCDENKNKNRNYKVVVLDFEEGKQYLLDNIPYTKESLIQE